MEQINDSHRILFVLVLYKCTVEKSRTFQTLLADFPHHQAHLFIYDNSPYHQETNIPVAEYVHDTANGGIGKAYNTACQYAQTHQYHWLMLLDQDTAFPPNAIAQYYKAIADNPNIQMIAPRHQIKTGEFMSPTHYRMKTSHLQSDTLYGIVKFKQAAPINSGILVSIASFLKVGGYDEPVWLDFSDIRFIEKYKRHYHSFYVIKDLVCVQNFSSEETDLECIFRRYLIYLECAANYPKETVLDTIAMTLTTLRITLSRTLKEKTFRYLHAYWNIYIRKSRHES